MGRVVGGGGLGSDLCFGAIDVSRGAGCGAAAGETAIGIGVMAAAIGLCRRTGQDPKPWESTPEIISTGVYRFTRNPMYAGMALLQAGIGLALASAWIITAGRFSFPLGPSGLSVMALALTEVVRSLGNIKRRQDRVAIES